MNQETMSEEEIEYCVKSLMKRMLWESAEYDYENLEQHAYELWELLRDNKIQGLPSYLRHAKVGEFNF